MITVDGYKFLKPEFQGKLNGQLFAVVYAAKAWHSECRKPALDESILTVTPR